MPKDYKSMDAAVATQSYINFPFRNPDMYVIMVIMNLLDLVIWEAHLKGVLFVMLVTDNGTHDEWVFMDGKYSIYTKYLPSHIKTLHFHSDGTACFNSILQKTAQLL